LCGFYNFYAADVKHESLYVSNFVIGSVRGNPHSVPISVIPATSKEFSQKTIFARQAGIQKNDKSQKNQKQLIEHNLSHAVCM
jgi:hypothetical protein